MSTPMPLDKRTLTRTVNRMPVDHGLIKSLFFPVRRVYPTGTIEWDVKNYASGKLPTINLGGEAVIIDRDGFDTRSQKAPKIRVKTPFRAAEVINERTAGQSAYLRDGESPEMALERLVSEQLQTLRRRGEQTMESWCGQAAVTGTLTETSPDNAFTIDYRKPADASIAVASGDKWDQEGADPSDLMEAANLLMQELAGVACDFVVMGSGAYKQFRARVAKDLDTRHLRAGELTLTAKSFARGNYAEFDVYAYGVVLPGETAPVVPADTVVFGSYEVARSGDNHLGFGVPEDFANDGRANEWFSKSYYVEDPSGYWLLIETRPMPVIQLPGSIVTAQVL